MVVHAVRDYGFFRGGKHVSVGDDHRHPPQTADETASGAFVLVLDKDDIPKDIRVGLRLLRFIAPWLLPYRGRGRGRSEVPAGVNQFFTETFTGQIESAFGNWRGFIRLAVIGGGVSGDFGCGRFLNRKSEQAAEVIIQFPGFNSNGDAVAGNDDLLRSDFFQFIIFVNFVSGLDFDRVEVIDGNDFVAVDGCDFYIFAILGQYRIAEFNAF